MSSTQVYALELVMLIEARDERKRDSEAFKRAIVSADPQRYLPLLYPEMNQRKVDAETLTEQEVMDESQGEWEFAEIDPAEAEKILNQMLQRPIGSMGMEDVEKFE